MSQLEVAWIYPTGDNRSYVFNPIVVDNVMYVLARNSSLVALDAATGKEIWIHENLPGLATRGIAYWESKDRKDRRLIFAINNYLQEIDARTGKSILTFGNNGLVDLREGLGRDPKTIVRIQPESPGRVFENLILLGSSTGEAYLSPPGDIRAYDVMTGKLVWTFHTIPHPGEFGYDTWPKDAWKYAGGANTWGEITVDEKRGIAYFPTGSPTYDYYGADRIGSNLFGNCLLALDARTGKRLWHFQMVHHDLWDYDNTAAPQLMTVRHDGKAIDVVAQSTQTGIPVRVRSRHGQAAVAHRRAAGAEEPHAGRAGVADAAVSDGSSAVRAAEDDGGRREPVHPDRRRARCVEGANREDAQRRAVHSAGTRRDDLDAGRSRRIELGYERRESRQRDWCISPRRIGRPSTSSSLEDPLAARRAARARRADQGQSDLRETMPVVSWAGWRGRPRADRPRSPASNRLELEAFRQVVASGRGEMPAFADLDAAAIAALHAFLAAPSAARHAPHRQRCASANGGPVVASGGAPGGLEIPEVEPRPSPLGGPPYPAGVDAPPNRYYTDWGLYPNQPYIIGPPWSAIVAYDLNTGTIKWRVPLGEDARAAAEGAKNAGVFMAERHGMIVTSTGLLFVATTDGKVRAHDEETGKVLWTGTLPAGSEGVPAMYEVNGRQVSLVVPASSRINTGGGHRRPGEPRADPVVGHPSYVAFALPRH